MLWKVNWEAMMDGTHLKYDDCMVLVETLRRRVVHDRQTKPAQLRAEIGHLIDLVETIGPEDALFRSGLKVARSLVVFEQLSSALDNIAVLLKSVQRQE